MTQDSPNDPRPSVRFAEQDDATIGSFPDPRPGQRFDEGVDSRALTPPRQPLPTTIRWTWRAPLDALANAAGDW